MANPTKRVYVTPAQAEAVAHALELVTEHATEEPLWEETRLGLVELNVKLKDAYRGDT